MNARAAALVAGALAAGGACGGSSGTVEVALVTAPGSTVIADAAQLRVTITNPPSTTTGARVGSGFDVEVDFGAVDTNGQIYAELLGSDGGTLAVGETPPFPLDAIDATVAIYVAPPMSFGATPTAFALPSLDVSAVPLVYGAALAGGTGSGDVPADEMEIYNAFDHSIVDGLALPSPRAGMAAGTGTSGLVYLVGGGSDTAGNATGTVWRFDPSVAPNGEYTDLGTHADLPTAYQLMVRDGDETFAISGTPTLHLDGEADTLTALTTPAFTPDVGASAVGSDGVTTAMFCSHDLVPDCARIRGGTADTPAVTGADREGHAMAEISGGRIAVVGGTLDGTPTLDAIIIDPATGAATTVTGALSTARLVPLVAATPRYVVVAGGTDPGGATLATADILDGTTLAHVATVPLATPRARGTAIALPNDQVLLVSGHDGVAAHALELFTPDLPQSSP